MSRIVAFSPLIGPVAIGSNGLSALAGVDFSFRTCLKHPAEQFKLRSHSDTNENGESEASWFDRGSK
jgi:hypothetical protein